MKLYKNFLKYKYWIHHKNKCWVFVDDFEYNADLQNNREHGVPDARGLKVLSPNSHSLVVLSSECTYSINKI